jgi:hypothetical protein
MCEGTKREIYWHTFSQLIVYRLPQKVIPHLFFFSLSKVKAAIPVEAWTGPEASRRLRLPDFKTAGT